MTPHSIELPEIQIPLIYTAPLKYKCEINTSCSHHSSNPTGVFGSQIFKLVSILHSTAAQGRLLTAGYFTFSKSLTKTSSLLFSILCR